jgi:hypothetical protein
MLLQFAVVSDNSIWIVDTQFLNWARVDKPASDPTSKVIETGKLIPRGFGVYAFEKRTAKSPSGICSVGVNLVGLGQTIKVYLRTNVPVKDFTMPAPIRQILYEIMPSDPAQIEQSILELYNGGETNTSGDPGGDSTVGVDPEAATQTGPGETGSGASDGGSLGGIASGIGGY